MQVGLMKSVNIEAGKEFWTIIEVDAPKSIISIMFQTEAYDIQFGFYKATDESRYIVENEGEEGIEMISHPVDMLEEVLPLQVIQSSESVIKVTFVANEEGFYKILFSNAHSWMRSKQLKYRCIVLKPVGSSSQQSGIAQSHLRSNPAQDDKMRHFASDKVDNN